MLLVAENLAVAMPGGSVLKDVSFALPPGRVLGLVGESGAGKSMIGRAIAGDLPPGFRISAGSLRFDGRDLLAMPPADRRATLGREIAFIPQEPMSALNPVRTIGSQFAEHFRRLGVTEDFPARTVAALEAVQLPRAESLLARYPHQLSGGMCQRVLIAMAFAGSPKLVIADEPTTALDVTVQARILVLLRELQARQSTGVVFITHDLRLAAELCDDVLVLYAGRPVERGTARAVLGAPRHPYTKCLSLANPPMHGAARGLLVLPDQMPGLMALAGISGCRFRARCPVAQPDCAQVEPPLAGGGHMAACLHPDLTPTIAAPPLPAPHAQTNGPTLLEVSGLAKRFATPRWMFRRQPAVTAAADVSFRVAAGEFVGLVGESGSGKSTIARLVVGLDQPSEGSIRLDGTDIVAASGAGLRRAAVQMVFQNPQSALNPRRRIGRIVTEPMAVRRTRGAETRAQELLAAVGMAAETASRYPSQLSGGQRQRVNIARALCVLPRLLVADEIASGLDVSVQAQLLALLARLRAEYGFAMLFISHDLSVVRHLCDRVLVMHQGRIVEQGPTAQVFDAPQHAYTRRLLDAVPREVPEPP